MRIPAALFAAAALAAALPAASVGADPVHAGAGRSTWSYDEHADGTVDVRCDMNTLRVTLVQDAVAGAWRLEAVEGPVSGAANPYCQLPTFVSWVLRAGSPATGFADEDKEGCDTGRISIGPLGVATAFSWERVSTCGNLDWRVRIVSTLTF